jgi:acetylene hydratase
MGKNLGITDGEWVWVETTHGKVKMKARLTDDMPTDLVQIPHGWWIPEETQGELKLSGVWEHSDGIILSDQAFNLDTEQGLPDMRGVFFAGYMRSKRIHRGMLCYAIN